MRKIKFEVELSLNEEYILLKMGDLSPLVCKNNEDVIDKIKIHLANYLFH